MNILGISALYHDSAATLVRDGEIIAAAQEERFSRRKHDARVPIHALLYVLREGNVPPDGVDAVVFYDKPITKFTRLLETHAEIAPRGLKTFFYGASAWLKDKGWIGLQLEQLLCHHGYRRPRSFYFTEHHLSHAASAFYPSPFEEAVVLTADGVGEWCCTSIAVGEGNRLRPLQEQRFPHSLGLLYSAFTYFTGFRVNSGEYKLMGLAPYGEPIYVERIKERLISIREDGSFRLDMSYFNFMGGLTMTNSKFDRLIGGPARRPESDLTRREMDLAASIQAVTEEIMLKMARYARAVGGKRHLCLAGGVALNCVANGKIHRERVFDDMWIQPAAGDAGGSLGAALYLWHHVLNKPRSVAVGKDSMKGSLLGPGYGSEEIKAFLDNNQIPYQEMRDAQRNAYIARALSSEQVVGLFQGRMEFGPRALGARSILADPRSTRMQSFLNVATKFRESFRPFAPIVLAEDCGLYFEFVRHSPYMLLVDRVRPELCLPQPGNRTGKSVVEWINEPRSTLPAVTHVDLSARIQTVDRESNPRLHDILTEFKRLTGCGVLVNTSFNVRSEPIVCTPEDAFKCFMRTGIQMLVLENFVLEKQEMPEWEETDHWREEFGLD